MDYDFIKDNFLVDDNGSIFRVDGNPVNLTESRGYLCFRAFGLKLSVHRVVYFLINGFIPEFIDHVDGDRKNNSPKNLRSATISQNNMNARIKSNNRSGFKGVSKVKKSGNFVSKIMANGKLHYLGEYKIAYDAAKAYDAAAIELHGEFARTNKMLGLID